MENVFAYLFIFSLFFSAVLKMPTYDLKVPI